MKTKDVLVKEKVNAFIELGVYFDSLIRKGEYKDEKASLLSQKIHECDKELYMIEKENNVEDNYKCPSCLKPLDKDTKFCSSCGYNIEEHNNRLVITCDFCGYKLTEDAKYCSVCGKKI